MGHPFQEKSQADVDAEIGSLGAVQLAVLPGFEDLIDIQILVLCERLSTEAIEERWAAREDALQAAYAARAWLENRSEEPLAVAWKAMPPPAGAVAA